MKIQAKTGLQSLTDGAEADLRLDKTGALVTTDAHARYQESVLKGNVFGGSIVGQVTSVGTNTTYTGLCLSNPNGSGVNLVINKVGFSFIVAFAAGAHIGLMTGFSTTDVTHTAAVTPRSKFFNNATTSKGKLDSEATLPVTPTVNQIFASGVTGAITTTPYIPSSYIDLEGSIILPPGAFCAIYTSTASGAASGAFSFTWEEIPA